DRGRAPARGVCPRPAGRRARPPAGPADLETLERRVPRLDAPCASTIGRKMIIWLLPIRGTNLLVLHCDRRRLLSGRRRHGQVASANPLRPSCGRCGRANRYNVGTCHERCDSAPIAYAASSSVELRRGKRRRLPSVLESRTEPGARRSATAWRTSPGRSDRRVQRPGSDPSLNPSSAIALAGPLDVATGITSSAIRSTTPCTWADGTAGAAS